MNQYEKEKDKCKKDNRQQKPLIPGYLLPDWLNLLKLSFKKK